MRLIKVQDLQPNMELAKPIYRDQKVLLNTGCQNIHNYKEKLLELGIHHIYVTDQKSAGITTTDVINPQTRQKSKQIIKEAMQNIAQNKKLQIAKINDAIKDIIDEIHAKDNVLVNLVDIKNTDDYTFEHSVNVTILSLLLGKALNYNQQRLKKLGVGAILHDIGKVAIPEDILKKPAQLTDKEYEIIKKHPQLGYKNIKEYHNISPLSKTIILSHHEKVNGSGYPNGATKEDIHEFGRIVAITDVFDALTSDRCYRNRWSIHKTVDFLLSQANEEFDAQLLNEFIKHIALYPNGTTVQLSTGEEGIVAEQNRESPTRPVVRVIKDKSGTELTNYKTIDLMEQLNIVIVNEGTTT